MDGETIEAPQAPPLAVPEERVVVTVTATPTRLLGVPHWSVTAQARHVKTLQGGTLEEIVGMAGCQVEDLAESLKVMLCDALKPWLKTPH